MVRDEWLQDKWDDKKVVETAQELEGYLLHKYAGSEINATSDVVE